MNPESVYQPIACALHEGLEFAVLKQRKLCMRYANADGQEMVSTVLPLDVYSAHAAEWLKMQHADGRTEILRLDAILSFADQI